DDSLCELRVEVAHKLRRTFKVSEYRCYCLAFALDGGRRDRPLGDQWEVRCGLRRWSLHGDVRGRERSHTFTTEAFVRLNRCAAFWAGRDEGCPAIRTEFAPFPIIAAAFGTAHIPIERLLAQLIEQRLGFFGVGRVEALGEP